MAIELTDILKITDTTSLKDFRDKIAELREEISRLKLEGKDYTEQAQKIDVVQKHLNEVMTSSKKYTTDAEGSFNALNARLRQLKEEWKATADSMRRDELTEQIKEVKGEMNRMNESIGNYQHNVGNYTNSIMDAFKQMGISFSGTSVKFASMAGVLTGGLAKLGTAFKSLWATMAANPIGAVLVAVGALVGAFSALRRAIRENEESEERLHMAMAAFRPISDKFKVWLDQMAQGFVNLVEALADAWNWLRKTYAAYTDWMGYTEGRQDQIKAEIKLYQGLADAENKMDNIRRDNQKKNSADQARIDELRQEAMETENLTEKKKMLTEAIGIQEKVNARNVKEAEAELKILQTQANLAPNSAAFNDQLAAAEAKVNDARAAGSRALRSLNRELNRYTKASGDARNKVDEHTKALEKEREAMLRAAEAEQKEADRIYKESVDALKSQTQLEEEEYKRRRQLLEDYNKDVSALDEAWHQKEVERQVEQQKEDYKRQEEALDNAYAMEERRRDLEGGESSNPAQRALQDAEDAEAELERFKSYVEEKIQLNELEMLLYEEGSEERTRIERENAELRMQVMEKEHGVFVKNDKAEKALLKAKEQAYKSMVSGTSSILKNLSSIMGENTKMGKGFAIAAATIDSIAAAVSGFRAGYNQWKDAGPMSWMAPVQGALNATMALAAGFAEVQKIRSVDTSGNSNGGGTATAMAIPNIEGLSSPVDYTRQVTTQTEQEEMNRDNRVYILESDIQESGNRVKVREEETTF